MRINPYIFRGYDLRGLAEKDLNPEIMEHIGKAYGTFFMRQNINKAIEGGVYISASHNPAGYNGCKFAIDFSETLVSQGIQTLRKMVEEEDYEKAATPAKTKKEDIREAYFNDLLKRLSLNKSFKVVIDPGHSTAGVIVLDLLRRAGCQVIEIIAK